MADRRIQMALGDFRFELGRTDYEKARRTLTWRWARQDVIGNYPVHQFVGEGARTLQLSGAIFPAVSGVDALDGLEQAASQRQALRLADEFGHFLGYWIITSLQLEDTRLLESKPLEQRYTLSLVYFGEQV